ncbi:MAS20-domain-containing protein [Trametes meyenii]|nr:MAS20-domain-containing protein [Trametes meyenii]
MSSSRTSTIFTVAAVTVLGGLVAYAVYFDYRRRNDVDFRKKLRKEKKKVTKETQQAQAKAEAASEVNPVEIKAALLKIREEDLPATPEEKEAFFITQIQIGEQLAQKGPAWYLQSAIAFFRALRVYPSPVELIMMLQSSLPAPLFKVCLHSFLRDTYVKDEEPAEEVETSPTRTGPPSETSSQEWDRYYDHFPAKHMNVSVQSGPAQANQAAKKILVAEKDFEPGEVIYEESPVVVALDADLEGKGIRCSYCFVTIPEGESVSSAHDKLDSVYCSEDCRDRASTSWQNILFGLEPVLPPELDQGMGELTTEQRDKAQVPFVEYIKAQKQAHLLAARVAAKQIAHETAKLLPSRIGTVVEELRAIADGKDQYSIGDHVERLRFVNGEIASEEVKLLGAVMGSALPGMEQSVQEERQATLIGKMEYNAIGVVIGEGRDDRPVSSDRPEELERTRTPYGTARQVGSGVFLVSSYLAHSCDPNTRPTFPDGKNTLHLVATKRIEKGDELTMAWVDVTRTEDQDAGLARRRRRIELARGWRFKCECAKCIAEVIEEEEKEKEEKDLDVQGDESKVENFMRHEKLPGEGMGPD